MYYIVHHNSPKSRAGNMIIACAMMCLPGVTGGADRVYQAEGSVDRSLDLDVPRIRATLQCKADRDPTRNW